MTKIKGYDQWKTASPYDNEPDPEEIPGISPSIQAILDHLHGGDDLYMFYRSIYKYTPCGPAIGFRINGEWKYCSDLPRHVGENDVVDAVSISSIVEGVDCEVPPHYCEGEFTTEYFWQQMDNVVAWADEIWDETHGCDDCEMEGQYGGKAINPNCKTCKGNGVII